MTKFAQVYSPIVPLPAQLDHSQGLTKPFNR